MTSLRTSFLSFMERGPREHFESEPKNVSVEKAEAFLRWGIPGHEDEYTLNLEGFDMHNFIHQGISNRIQEALGEGYFVMNRGTRLEIMPQKERDDALVRSTVEQVLADLPEWLLPEEKTFQLRSDDAE